MTRTVGFPPDGHRIFATPVEIVTTWIPATLEIPARFAVGTSTHETDLTVNEVDVEETGFETDGIYQVSHGEAKSVGMSSANLLELAACSRVFAHLCHRHLATIIAAAKLRHAAKWSPLRGCFYADPASLPPDVWAYLSIAHNQGDEAVRSTIANHGLDWQAYKKRNLPIIKPGFNGPKVCAYGDDVISGGVHWSPQLAELERELRGDDPA